ncbi:LysE/ArgO family amino acid transporter [Acidocella sp.]|uniref:LysE/ArgO family amino acid transporter n=1 Tax=Acidocella sp. TaxID=50710 RepID=UPI002601987C|nr:LysE family transporter [Acidocella sp.]
MDEVVTPFVTGFLASSALIVAIGAQNLFVLRQGLRREHVGAIVLFCGTADALLMSAGVGGVGALLGAVPVLKLALALGGAGFLGWYGVGALRRMAAPGAMNVTGNEGVTLPRALAATAAFTFLNPHVYLDTVLLLGTLGGALAPALRPVFVAGAAMASFVWFAGLGYGARLLRPVFAKPQAWRVLDALVGTVMLSLAASLLWRALG